MDKQTLIHPLNGILFRDLKKKRAMKLQKDQKEWLMHIAK